MREGCDRLMFVHSLLSYVNLVQCLSLGRVFGLVKAQRRVSIFEWTVTWGKILTCENLMKRGCTLEDWCCMCRYSGEVVDLLLMRCIVAHFLWSYVFGSFEIQWGLPMMVMHILFGWTWRNWFGKHSLDIWNLVPFMLGVGFMEGMKLLFF